MCGILAVLQRTSTQAAVDLAAVSAGVARSSAALAACEVNTDTATFSAVAQELAAVDQQLRTVAGVQALVLDEAGAEGFAAGARTLAAAVAGLDARLDAAAQHMTPAAIEACAEALTPVRDAAWSLGVDRVRMADAVRELARGSRSLSALRAFHAIEIALSGIDRLEVRGRDSAGVHIMVTRHGLNLDDPALLADIATRNHDVSFTDMAVRIAENGVLCFVYKAAAEIGDLGDNTRHIRSAIVADDLLHRVLSASTAEVSVLAHTRWASVGMISEPNAHPVNHEERSRREGPYAAAALNGDIDNYADLAALDGVEFPAGITTDAKVIPALFSRRVVDAAHTSGVDASDVFRNVVASFEGSIAIALQHAADPDTLLLALRGSGQGLFVGASDDTFIVASEPYGLVQETSQYIRLDGELGIDGDRTGASNGQVVILRRSDAGDLLALTRLAYNGTELPMSAADLQLAQITTRDINRGSFPHFLFKEISEAPLSFRKTLRGRLTSADGRWSVQVGPETVPAELDACLRSGAIRRVIVIGQGTAAIAAQSCARFLSDCVARTGHDLVVEAMPATELSGFRLVDDMSDTCVVAISQSGTTTDTNRTVDVARARGASVIAIVNRRNSDLVEKSDGVMYTSDGRDIEMSVASTKAFYAQIAAGVLLAGAIAERVAGPDAQLPQELLASLHELPEAMESVLSQRKHIADVAQRYAPMRRSWAVVGSGPNLIAAHELRIKCSELCYKAVACDAIEDKKHIDLSSEPLILVCAAGFTGSLGDDVAKELAIYRAHKAAPIAIVNEGDDRYRAAVDVIAVPVVHSSLSFVLCAMAGHLFGYEAALAIDATALPLRTVRAAIEEVFGRSGDTDVAVTAAPFNVLAAAIADPTNRFFTLLRTGAYDGSLDADIAVKVASLLRYASGMLPLDAFQVEFGKVGTPAGVVEDLTAALTRAIEGLTRSIDTIKHQAKTVTVGISRTDETLLRNELIQAALETGVSRDGLSYKTLRTLAALSPAVESVLGFTRYRIQGDPATDGAFMEIVDRGGVALGIPSRVDREPVLRGTKQLVATEREISVARGRSDGRTVIIVPEVKGTQTVGIALLHVKFHEHVAADVMRSVLEGYRNRYAALRSAVTETEPTFDDARLARLDVVEVLTRPVVSLAEHWRAS